MKTVADRLSRLDLTELDLLLAFNRTGTARWVAIVFGAISRIGDGVFWYALMLAMTLIWGMDAVPAVLRMGAVGIVGVVIYKIMKLRIKRFRPCDRHKSVKRIVPPLDQYSFPSGHTLHAVGFSVMACAHFPVLAWVLVPLATLIAISRMVLGLHYPSDVLVGGMIGAALSLATLALVSAAHAPVTCSAVARRIF